MIKFLSPPHHPSCQGDGGPSWRWGTSTADILGRRGLSQGRDGRQEWCSCNEAATLCSSDNQTSKTVCFSCRKSAISTQSSGWWGCGWGCWLSHCLQTDIPSTSQCLVVAKQHRDVNQRILGPGRWDKGGSPGG